MTAAIDDIEALLQAAPLVPLQHSTTNIAGVSTQVPNLGEAAALWRDAPAAVELLAAFREGVDMHTSAMSLAFMAARHGACAETIELSLKSLLAESGIWGTRPSRAEELHAGELRKLAEAAVRGFGMGDASPNHGAVDDFAGAPTPEGVPATERDVLFRDFAWCERQSRAIEIATGHMLDRTQLDSRLPGVGTIGTQRSAWSVFLQHGDLRRNVTGLTFRPGDGRIVLENLPALQGECVNTWLPPVRALPPSPSAEAVQVFLDHAALVVPDAREREVVLNWMAWVAQNPREKPSFALVLGSTNEGMGKDTLLQPFLYAVGREYVREISADELVSGFTGYRDRCKVLVVQEMENFERKKTSNLLKPLIAAPPETLRVNEKNVRPYDIPNTIACVFMTNEDAAIQVSSGDRRYLVTWNDGEPQPSAYFDKVWAWMKSGGEALAAAWLMTRDVSGFDAKGRAPHTEAKDAMRKAGRTALQEWVDECVADATAPFDTDIIALAEVCARVPRHLAGHQGVRSERLLKMLKPYKPLPLGRMRVGMLDAIGDGPVRLCAIRNQATYAKCLEREGPDAIKGLYCAQRARAAHIQSLNQVTLDFKAA